MVTKNKQDGAGKRSKKKTNNMKLNKETVKDMGDSQTAKIKGGARMVSIVLCLTEICVPPTITKI